MQFNLILLVDLFVSGKNQKQRQTYQDGLIRRRLPCNFDPTTKEPKYDIGNLKIPTPYNNENK